VLATVLGLVLLIPFMRLPPNAMQWVRVFGALGLLGVLGIVLLLSQRALTEKILTALLARTLRARLSPDKWLQRWRNLMSGFDALGSVRGALVVTAWTLASWVTTVGVFWAIMQAFIPGASWVQPTFIVCVQAFGMAVPATPGNWGVFEMIGRVGLVAPFGIPDAQAFSYTVVVHFFEYLAVNAFGVIALIKYSLSLGDISAKAESVEQKA
jgi:uncharacterized membrane protein YbhN (UPF0104 family)